MSALVESMFSVRETPWHGQGLVADRHPADWAEARTWGGLDWEPIDESLYELVGVDADGRPTYQPVTSYRKIVRSDTKATLAVASSTYELITHAAMGEIIDAVIGADKSARYETAGSLNGGKAVWCLVALDEPIELAGDTSATVPYLAITNRHDGTAACALRATAVRIVCMNTFRAAELEGEQTGATFSFRHSAGWRDRIEEAREAIRGARAELVEYRKLSEELLGIPVTAGQRELFVRTFVPAPPDGLVTDRVMANVEQARTAIRNILASETTAPVAHTAYGLVQASVEYLDHVRKAKSWETRLNRTMIRPEPLKAKALRIVRDVVTVDV